MVSLGAPRIVASNFVAGVQPADSSVASCLLRTSQSDMVDVADLR